MRAAVTVTLALVAVALGASVQAATFPATFEGVRGNAWWVEVEVVADRPVAGVRATVGPAVVELEKKSWGSWAKSVHAPDGTIVRFEARDGAGATATSGCWRWTAVAAVTCPSGGASTPSTVSGPLAVVGDTGHGTRAEALVELALARGAEGLAGLGDYAYDGDAARWKSVFAPLTDQGSWSVVGNHDAASAYADVLPGGTATWSRALNGARLVGLDTSTSADEDSAAFATARAALCGASEEQRILLLHKPWWLLEGADHPASESPADPAALDALVDDCGVDLVLAAHEHNYQRRAPGGVPHVIVGTGGESLYPLAGVPSDTVASCSCYGVLLLEVSATSFRGEFRALDGSVRDTFSRGGPPTPAAWERHAELFPVRTTGGLTTRSFFEGSRGWNLWAKGHVQQAAPGAAADAELRVAAFGTSADGVGPTMVVTVDGREVLRRTVTAYATHVADLGVLEAGDAVRIAFVNDLKTATEDRNLYLDTIDLVTGPSPPPSPFDATFRNVRGNAWWVETDVTVTGGTLAGVDARVDGGAWVALEKKSWGSWAKSLHAPAGSVVEFRARATDGATDTSAAYAWPP